MSYIIVPNRTVHTGTGSTATVEYEKLVTADFAVTINGADRCVITNMTSPLGRPETVEYQFQTVSDAYANTGIDRALIAPSKRGRAFYVATKATPSAVDDDADPGPEYATPVQCSIRVKVTDSPLVTDTLVEDTIKRAYAAIFPNGVSMIPQLLRGSVNPLLIPMTE